MGGPREDGDRDSLHFPRMGRARAKYVHVGPPAEKNFLDLACGNRSFWFVSVSIRP